MLGIPQVRASISLMDRELEACCVSIAQQALNPQKKFNSTSLALTRKLEQLYSILSDRCSPLTSSKIAELVFFSLKALLQQEELGTRQTELLFKCFTILCSTTWRNYELLGLERAQQLIAVTTYLLSPEPSLEKTSPKLLEKPSSFHAAAFNLLTAIYKLSVNTPLHSPLSLSTTLVQVISLALDVLQYYNEDLLTQLASIECLKITVAEIITSEEQRAMVLPLVVSKLVKVISPRNRRHYRAKVAAIYCLRETVVGTLNDESFRTPNSCKIRTEEWLKTTIEKLSQSFEVLNSLQTSLLEVTGGRPELLRALYDISCEVLVKCGNLFDVGKHETQISQDSKTLRNSLIKIILLSMSQSADLKLADDAHRFLIANAQFVTVLNSMAYDQLGRLPGVLSSTNELSTQFFLQCLANSIKISASSDLSEPLINAIELALPISTRTRPIYTETVREIEPYKENSTTYKFTDLNSFGLNVNIGSLPISTQSQKAISNVLQTMSSKLSNLDANQLIVDISNKLNSLKLRSKHSLDAVSLLWIVGQMLPAIAADCDIYDLVIYCFNGINDGIIDTDNGVAISQESHTALCCYAIGEAALLQGSKFQEYLADLMFPLFALLGHGTSAVVRDQAKIAIAKLAFACGYQFPREMVIANKDYLVDGWSLQINSLQMTPSTLESLTSLIYISGEDIIPYLDDVFASLFVLLDHYHGYDRLVRGVLSIFGALTYMVSQNQQWKLQIESNARSVEIGSFTELINELKRKPEIDPSIEQPQSLTDYRLIKDQEATKLKIGQSNSQHSYENSEFSGDSDDENGDKNSEDSDRLDAPEQPIEKWECPISKPVYFTLQKISEYCDKLLTHESSEIRVTDLVLLSELIPFLAVNKDYFLPLVHKVWPEVIARSFDAEIYVVEQSLRCISMITMTAQDFVASRVDQLWPRLMDRYAILLQRKWPVFAPEKRICDGLSGLFSTVVQQIPDVSLAVLESGVVTFRAAFLRGEYASLKMEISRSKPSAADLLWLVLLAFPETPPDLKFHQIIPLYN